MNLLHSVFKIVRRVFLYRLDLKKVTAGTSMADEIDQYPCPKRKQHYKDNVQEKPLHPKHDLQSAEIGDLRRRTGDHESRGPRNSNPSGMGKQLCCFTRYKS